MRIEKIKVNTPEAQNHLIPELEKPPKSDTRMEKTGTHKYRSRPITKRINNTTTFKNAPNMFKIDAEEKI